MYMHITEINGLKGVADRDNSIPTCTCSCYFTFNNRNSVGSLTGEFPRDAQPHQYVSTYEPQGREREREEEERLEEKGEPQATAR